MDYLTVKEASILWKMDVSKIGKLIRQGRINGAIKAGNYWLIPKGESRPLDGRTKQAKGETEDIFFRFPLYLNLAEDAYIPQLSKEEIELSRAQKATLACDFNLAIETLDKLIGQSDNIYIKLSSLFFRCYNSLCFEGGQDFLLYFNQIYSLLTKDFPHKKEMELFIPWLESSCAQYRVASDLFKIDAAYNYDESTYHFAQLLSFYHLLGNKIQTLDMKSLDVYEIACRQFEYDKCFYEACELHLNLFTAHYLGGETEAAIQHLKKCFDIAHEHGFILTVADYESYFPAIFKKVLVDYPQEFVSLIYQYSNPLYNSFKLFNQRYNFMENIFDISKSDYQYALYASRGYTNKQVAEIMKLSEKTVSNRYSLIYEKLGVNGKSGLKELMLKTQNGHA